MIDYDNDEEILSRFVRLSLERRKHVVLFELARMFHGVISLPGAAGEFSTEQDASAWIPVASLSMLRARVGGRFQNLKDRWVKAGFPLREHRGDRSQDASVELDGWAELVSWMSTQGFESRLAAEGEACFFFVREKEKTTEQESA